MYKRLFFLYVAVCLILGTLPLPVFAAEQVKVPEKLSADSAFLMVADTGEILFAKNETQRRPMASTTKIMTALLALESGKLQQEIIVTPDMLQVEGSSIGLLPGDRISLKTLVSGMLLKSGNDAANVTAHLVSGNIPTFLEEMNQKAQELGMQHTHFATVSGLDADGHYSTAADMAILAAYALKNPLFKTVCAQQSEQVFYGNPPFQRTLTNHNKLLKQYDGTIGVKTGFTKKSGRCLVSAAQRNHVVLICVTLNAPNDWDDHEKLLDYGFSIVHNRVLSEKIPSLSQTVVGGKESTVSLKLQDTLTVPVSDSSLNYETEIYKMPFLYAPVKANTVVGKVVVRMGEKIIKEVPLVTSAAVESVSV